MKASAHSREQKCPECGGSFTLGLAGRKKVQCPKCRKIVTLADFESMNRTPGRASADADWVAHCENLRARVETLEQQVEAIMVAARNRLTPLLPEPVESEGTEPDELPAPQRDSPPVETPSEAISQPIRTPSTDERALLIKVANWSSQRVAETVSEILAGAGWKVSEIVEDAVSAQGSRGLTLVASRAIALSRVTSSFRALREAGFGLTLQIDPDRAAHETILIVGPGSVAEK